MGLIYRLTNRTAGTIPVQVTDGLPRIGPQTLVAAIVLTLMLALGLHVTFKTLTWWLSVRPLVIDNLGDIIAERPLPKPLDSADQKAQTGCPSDQSIYDAKLDILARGA